MTSIELADGNYIYFEYDEKYNIQRNVYVTYTKELNNDLRAPLPYVSVSKELTQSEIPSNRCGGLDALPELSPKMEEWRRNGRFGNTELFLKKITWGGGNRIDFIHSVRNDYGEPYDSKDHPVCLAGFEVRTPKNKLVKGYSFGYSYFNQESGISSLAGSRLCLDWLKEYHVGGYLPSYNFTYDTRYRLPLKTSLCFDVWGYYNGTSPFDKSKMESLCPEIVSDKNGARYFDWEFPSRGGNIVVNGRNMRCNPDCITTGMLKRIDYPTGGFVEFTFEPNTYISNFQSTEKKGGGVRIAKIKTNATERIFDYNENGKSSGLLLVQPIFHYYLTINGLGRSIYKSRSVVQLQGTRMGNFVGYGKVTETIICDNKKSSIVDYFHNDLETIGGTLYTYDVHDLNGMLKKTFLYDDSVLVLMNIYEYGSLPIAKRPNQKAMKYDDGIMYCYNVFPSQHKRISAERKTSFLSNGKTEVSSTVYSYNDDNYAVNKILKIGNGKDIITKTIYTSDLNKGVYSELNANNIIKPVEVTQYINKNGVEQVIGSQLTLYNGYSLPIKVYKLEADVPLNDFITFTSTIGDSKDSRYSAIPELELSYYDGNVILLEESTTRDGLHEFYIWGHSNSCILAKIENATKTQIQQYIPNYDRLYEDEPTDALYQQINNLRTQLPQARVTTYIYDSLIGLKQCISPDGTSIYYEYDNHNRLKCIKDNSGKVIEQYEYGYKQ